MVRVEVSGGLPVPRSEAFNYVTDMRQWPSFFPGFVCVLNPETARWSNPGDRVTVVSRLFGRESHLHMELEVFAAGERVRFVLRQRGLPAAHHERHFIERGEGCECRFITTYTSRSGLTRLLDRSVVKWGIERALRHAVTRIQSHYATHAV
jgi:hypothetical protein